MRESKPEVAEDLMPATVARPEAHGGTIEWRDAAPGTEFVLSVPLDPNGRAT